MKDTTSHTENGGKLMKCIRIKTFAINFIVKVNSMINLVIMNLIVAKHFRFADAETYSATYERHLASLYEWTSTLFCLNWDSS